MLVVKLNLFSKFFLWETMCLRNDKIYFLLNNSDVIPVITAINICAIYLRVCDICVIYRELWYVCYGYGLFMHNYLHLWYKCVIYKELSYVCNCIVYLYTIVTHACRPIYTMINDIAHICCFTAHICCLFIQWYESFISFSGLRSHERAHNRRDREGGRQAAPGGRWRCHRIRWTSIEDKRYSTYLLFMHNCNTCGLFLRGYKSFLIIRRCNTCLLFTRSYNTCSYADITHVHTQLQDMSVT